MTTFIVLCKFDDGVDVTNLDSQPRELADRVVTEMNDGSQVKDLWLTGGGYDMVAVVEAPDNDAASTFVLAFNSLGRVRTMTLWATGNIDDTVRRAIEAKTNIGSGDEGGGGGGGRNPPEDQHRPSRHPLAQSSTGARDGRVARAGGANSSAIRPAIIGSRRRRARIRARVGPMLPTGIRSSSLTSV